jgi:uncharacterized protein (UPF0335 family)
MNKIFNTIIGTYRIGRIKYELYKKYDNIKFIYNHLEDMGLNKKRIFKIIKLMIRYPKLLSMNPLSLLGFIVEYFI